MNRKQIIGIISPIIILFMMYPIFQFLSKVFQDNWRIGWILGLMTYWLIWGIAYPLFIVGKKNIRGIIKPQKVNMLILLLVLFPLVMTIIFKSIAGGMVYEKPNLFVTLLFIFSAFGNGFFEELLWRGIYMKLFPNNLWLRIAWPSIWFGLWHYAPGSISPDNEHILGLIIGSVFLGFYSGFMVKITNTIWWSIIIHTVGGIIMVLL